MKKLNLVFLVLIFVPSVVFSDDFVPFNKLDIDVHDFVQYNFDGNPVDIPVEVSGTYARCYLIVDTKGLAETMPRIRNGYIGWHTINGIDTTVYTSAGDDFDQGNNIITWSGMGQDGTPVLEAEYTYYVWAFDYYNMRQPASCLANYRRNCCNERMIIQTRDENYVPMPKPWLATAYRWPNTLTQEQKDAGMEYDNFVWQKWVMGDDPFNTDLIETCKFPDGVKRGTGYYGRCCFQPDDFNYVYRNLNDEAGLWYLKKYKLIPNDVAEVQTDWGTDLVWTYPFPASGPGGWFINDCGTSTDNTYIYFPVSLPSIAECNPRLVIVSLDGDIVDDIYLEEWDKAEFVAQNECAKIRAGGPQSMEVIDKGDGTFRYGMAGVYCMHMCVDPLRYLESGDYEDLIVSINEEGDNFVDRGSFPDSVCPHDCYGNDFPRGYSHYGDKYGISMIATQRSGPISWCLLTPDNTAIDYCSIAGELDTGQDSVFPINMGTAYDGLYLHPCSWSQIEKPEELASISLMYLGHDSDRGIIGKTPPVAVADDIPSAFAVAQSSPNPFNPTTTISFTIPEAGNVNVDVFNVAGQKVDTLVNDFMDAGSHSVVWDGSNRSSGVYFYTVTSGEFTKTMKMTLLR